MSSVTITYNTVEKRFYLPYTYTNKRKQVRSVNPRPVTFRSLAIQVIRAQGRGHRNFSWQNPIANPALSVEGNLTECYLYRFENGNPLTVFSGSFPDVLRYLFMLSKNGNPEHRQILKSFQFNINIS